MSAWANPENFGLLYLFAFCVGWVGHVIYAKARDALAAGEHRFHEHMRKQVRR